MDEFSPGAATEDGAQEDAIENGAQPDVPTPAEAEAAVEVAGDGDPVEQLRNHVHDEIAKVHELVGDLRTHVEGFAASLHEKLDTLVAAGNDAVTTGDGALDELLKAADDRLTSVEARLNSLGAGGEGVGDALQLAQYACTIARGVATAMQRAVGVDVLSTLPPAPGVDAAKSNVEVMGAETLSSITGDTAAPTAETAEPAPAAA